MRYDVVIQRACNPRKLPQLPEGVPLLPEGALFLVSRVSGVPLEAPLHFFMETAFSSIGSKRLRVRPSTYKGIAEDLVALYDFLDERQLVDMEVRKTDMDAYVDSMTQNISPVTGERYSHRTVKRRVSTMRSFYKWAQSKGKTKYRFDVGEVNASSFKHHSTEKIAPDVLEPSSIAEDADVRAINVDELARLLEAAGPSGIESIDVSRPDTNYVRRETTALRLKLECCLQAGLRRAEVTALLVKNVEAVTKGASLSPLATYPVRTLRKGGQWKTVLIPGWLISSLAHYIGTERARLIAAATERDPGLKDHGFLFIRSDRAGPGLRLHAKSLNDAFRNLQKGIGVIKQVAVSRNGKQLLESRPKYGVHSLRHTFAVHTYFARKAIGDAEPWKYLQSQLGHANVETTKRIYLRIVDEHEAMAGAILSTMLKQRVFGHG